MSVIGHNLLENYGLDEAVFSLLESWRAQEANDGRRDGQYGGPEAGCQV